ncbi:MAG: hypothetical protein ABSH51_17845 [Solirubrobacteraceae bacterium]
MENVPQPAVDAAIACAADAYGHVSRAQLIALGLGRGAIDHRIKVGRLIVVGRALYAVGHRRADPPAVAAAAVRCAGPGAVLSHSSAAFLWGLTTRWELPPEVTAPCRRRAAGLRTHRSTTR